MRRVAILLTSSAQMRTTTRVRVWECDDGPAEGVARMCNKPSYPLAMASRSSLLFQQLTEPFHSMLPLLITHDD